MVMTLFTTHSMVETASMKKNPYSLKIHDNKAISKRRKVHCPMK